MYYELTKKEKKIARACIDKAFLTELKEGLEKFETILQDWRSGKFETDRHAYADLYNKVKNHEKAIYRKYNDGGSGNLLLLVSVLYRDGYIHDEDINDLSEEARKRIIALKTMYENE